MVVIKPNSTGHNKNPDSNRNFDTDYATTLKLEKLTAELSILKALAVCGATTGSAGTGTLSERDLPEATPFFSTVTG